MKTIKGDLIQLALEGRFDVIVHGCNCMHTMGAGIARRIKEVFPEAYRADRKTQRGSNKLGTCSYAIAKVDADKTCYIINAYTQVGYGAGRQVSYDAIDDCFTWIKNNFPCKRIGIPRIGAGLAGGNWDAIKAIIKDCMRGEDVTIVEYGGK